MDDFSGEIDATEEADGTMARAIGSATSSDGVVMATVDGWGVLTSLRIRGHEDLARTVTAVIREAAGDASAGTRSTVESPPAGRLPPQPPVGTSPDLRGGRVPALPALPAPHRRDADDEVNSIYDYD